MNVYPTLDALAAETVRVAKGRTAWRHRVHLGDCTVTVFVTARDPLEPALPMYAPMLTDAERACLAIVQQAERRILAREVKARLIEMGVELSDSSVAHALASLVRQGLLHNLKPAPRGYKAISLSTITGNSPEGD